MAAELCHQDEARATVRWLREAGPGMSVEHHVRQMMIYTGLRDRMAEPVATLRRLWAATESETKSA